MIPQEETLMSIELNAVQRRVATRYSRLVHDLSGERVARASSGSRRRSDTAIRASRSC